MATLSIVIPTHDRWVRLVRVLDAIATQDGPPPHEVVVVDDGSRDGTGDRLRKVRYPFPLQVSSQPNRGPAVARNQGIRLATGEWVALLGDDTIPLPGWLAAHRARLGDDGPGPVASLGHIDWDPRIPRTRFLHYLNYEGGQFGFGLIQDPEDLPFSFFYSSNLVIRRELLLAEPFHEGFPGAAWEDTELGYRLTRKGLRIRYLKAAAVHHDHPTDFRSFTARQEKAGYSAVVFDALHPELGSWLGVGGLGPPELDWAPRRVLREAWIRGCEALPVSMPETWYEGLRQHYIRGMRRAWLDGRGRVPDLVAGPG